MSARVIGPATPAAVIVTESLPDAVEDVESVSESLSTALGAEGYIGSRVQHARDSRDGKIARQG